MDDSEKFYLVKLLLGLACGVLSIIVIPQDLISFGYYVGWMRLIWLVATWLGVPFLIVFLALRLGWLGRDEKEKARLDELKQRGETLPKFKLKESLNKLGGWKWVLKTGVGAFFVMFMISSTLLFTILYP